MRTRIQATSRQNLGRRGRRASYRLASQPADTNHPRSTTSPDETRNANRRVGIASVRGRSQGGGWWGGWRSPPPWPVASWRSLPLSQQLLMAARRAFAGDGMGIGGVGLEGRRGERGQKDSAVEEGKSSSNGLVLGVASERRRTRGWGTMANSAQLARGPPRMERSKIPQQ